ncbi:hypothetical protein AVEN_152135-1 [Araneus ventricosus]|uniref:Uncharacterized protein n=1 Tax=Araneus ventricosus TaxID=182803 RepID=A0A4Y2T5J9_ARAVE|nr:hypothetical protein AVEN_152135-1 [Araneus ventricosus]
MGKTDRAYNAKSAKHTFKQRPNMAAVYPCDWQLPIKIESGTKSMGKRVSLLKRRIQGFSASEQPSKNDDASGAGKHPHICNIATDVTWYSRSAIYNIKYFPQRSLNQNISRYKQLPWYKKVCEILIQIIGFRVERRHHLQSVCLQDVLLADQTDENRLGLSLVSQCYSIHLTAQICPQAIFISRWHDYDIQHEVLLWMRQQP